jgi:predicted membrane protein
MSFDNFSPHRPFRPSMAGMRPNSVTPQLVLGMFIIAAGVLLTLGRLDLIDVSRALRFWPLALVALGATLLVQRRDGAGRFWGFAWIFIGAWFLLNSLGVVRVGFWELVWPLMLVLFGLSLVAQALRRGPSASAAFTDGSNLFAVMGESKRTVSDAAFRGSHMTAIMGGCMIDLRQATIAPGEEAVIDVFGFMAGHEVVVPPDWSVVSHIVPIAGGVADKRLPVADAAAPGGPPPPRLVIRGVLVFAGIEIKS